MNFGTGQCMDGAARVTCGTVERGDQEGGREFETSARLVEETGERCVAAQRFYAHNSRTMRRKNGVNGGGWTCVGWWAKVLLLREIVWTTARALER